MNDSTNRPICLTSIIKNEQRQIVNKSLFVAKGLKRNPNEESDWKHLYLEELRKRTEGEEAINSLQKLCQDYRDMFLQASNKRYEEVEYTSRKDREHEENRVREVEARTRHDTKYSTLKDIVIAMSLVLIIPILDKLYGCSWSSFAMKLVIFPACTALLIVLVEFIGMRFFGKHIGE